LFPVLPVFLLFLCLIHTESASADKFNVYWGGVGFTGTWVDRDQLYPFSSRLLCNPQNDCKAWGGNIDEMARDRLASKNFDNIHIDLNMIEDEVEGIIMAVGITSEILGVTKDIVNKRETFQHVFRIFGSLMFYEFYSGKMIKSVPIIIRYTTHLDAPANDNEKFDIIKNILGSDSLGINFFDIMYQQTKSVNLAILPSKYTQITEIILSKNVSDIMTKRLKLNNFKMQVAQIMEAEFVARADGPLIPSAIGLIPSATGRNVIEGKIKATFSDAERELTLPEATFNIGLDVRLFKKFEKIKGPQKTVCHAVAVTLRLADEMDEFTNVKFSRVKDSCGIASVDQVFDPTFYFPETLFTLIQNITKQFSKSGPNKDWLATHARKTPDAMGQIIRGRKTAFEVW
jgi:hypothetical protein